MPYPQDPLYAINDYVWQLLKQTHGWTKIDSKIPITPSRETPEFDGQTKPYLVYKGSRETGRGDLSPVRLATVQYLVYTTTASNESATNQVTEVLETLDNALNRLDESAYDINRNAHHPSNPRGTLFIGTHVTWTRVLNTESSDPGDAEGGKAVGYISIRYEYTVTETPHPILY